MSCYFQRRYLLGIVLFVGIIITYILRMALNLSIIPVGDSKKWGDSTRGILLSAFYWGYIITQVPGGWLSKKYGSKVVFGWGIASASLFTIVWPFTVFSFELSVFTRVLTGIGEGVTFPAVYHLIALWYPKNEKSTITSICLVGPTFGTVIANGLSPILINHLRWESIFFLGGGIGLLWSVLWLLLAIDHPSDKLSTSIYLPSEEEINYIKSNQDRDGHHSSDVSLAKIFTEPAFLCAVLNHFAYNWGYYIFASWLPTYLKKKLSFDLESAGFISVLPYLLMTIIGMPAGYVADKLISKNIASTLFVRRMFQMLGTLLPALFLVLLCFIPNLNATSAVAIMICALATTPFTTAGHSSNFLDLSTKHVSLLFSISNAVATIPGIVGVYITGFILNETQNWDIVFLLAASIYFVAALSFLFFSKAEKIDFDQTHLLRNIEEQETSLGKSFGGLEESFGYQSPK